MKLEHLAFGDIENILRSIVQEDGLVSCKIYRKLIDALIARQSTLKKPTAAQLVNSSKLINDAKLLIDSESSIFNGVQAIGASFDPSTVLHLIENEKIKFLFLFSLSM